MKTDRTRPYPHFKFPDEITISCRPATPEEIGWHSLKEGSHILKAENYGWFPTAILAETVGGVFSDTKNLGLSLSGNLGTASVGVVALAEAVRLLLSAGYNVTNEDLIPIVLDVLAVEEKTSANVKKPTIIDVVENVSSHFVTASHNARVAIAVLQHLLETKETPEELIEKLKSKYQ